MSIQRLKIDASASDKKKWDTYVAQHSEATLYHSSKWFSLITKLFKHTVYAFYKLENDLITGVLPMVRIQSRIFGDYYVAMPYVNYGGVLADTDEIKTDLISYANQFVKSEGGTHIEYRHTFELAEFDNEALPVRTDKVLMVLELPENEEALWKAIGSKVRAQVKRPQRENVSVKHGGLEMVDDFYTVFARNMRDLGTPVYAKALFSSIIENFPDSAHIVVVYHEDKPAAAGFTIGYKGRLEIPWASALREYNKISVNMLLYWEILKYAIEAGYKEFDFGRSTINAGTYRFKKQWGAKPQQLYWHYWLREGGEPPQMNPHNPKYQLVIKIWQKMPVWLTKIIGPSIVKNLP